MEGVVERTFGTDRLVRTERVNGAHEVTYSFYDANGLPGTVGELSLTRHPDTAEVTQARLRGTVESRSYDSLGELARLGAPGYSAFYTRDPLGRIARIWEFAGEAERVWDYAYDASNRLQSVQRNGALVVAYTYDPDGNRLRAEGEAGVVTGDLRRSGPPPDVCSAVVARFVYASRANVPDYFSKDGRTYRISVDHLGSPRAVVDMDTGEVVQRLDFGPFGEVTQDTNPGFQPFGFAGGLYDPDTGLVRFGARVTMRRRVGGREGIRLGSWGATATCMASIN